jgi:hypothetical protein
VPLCTLPIKPAKAVLLSAHSILERACDSAQAFIDAFATVRRARKAKGTATDHEQDLMRAALIFAAAGLDSMVKQLVRDTLQLVIAKDRGAHSQFTDYVQGRLRRMDGADLRFLAEALAADRPAPHLQQELVRELTSSSLQSKDQLLRVAGYFAIPANEISKDLNKLQAVFQARNQIAHEMAHLVGSSKSGKTTEKVEDHGGVRFGSSYYRCPAVAFYSAVQKRL